MEALRCGVPVGSYTTKYKAWVSANYSTWNDEKPDWFTELVNASVPKDTVPPAERGRADVNAEKRKATYAYWLLKYNTLIFYLTTGIPICVAKRPPT